MTFTKLPKINTSSVMSAQATAAKSADYPTIADLEDTITAAFEDMQTSVDAQVREWERIRERWESSGSKCPPDIPDKESVSALKRTVVICSDRLELGQETSRSGSVAKMTGISVTVSLARHCRLPQDTVWQ